MNVQLSEQITVVLKIFVEQASALLGSQLSKIILYGSRARGDNRPDSDIDIMLLTTLPEESIRNVEEQLSDIAFDLQMTYHLDISVIVKNSAQFQYWLGALPFYDHIQEEGITIYG